MEKKNAKIDADHTTSLLRSDKRVQIARGGNSQVSNTRQLVRIQSLADITFGISLADQIADA